MPEISVIVPARDAAATLGRTLAALAAQGPGADHEVVVVDDGSADGTAAVAERWGAVVVRHSSALGPAGARNAGVAVATAAALAFTDADCEPAPGWLAAGLAALRDADVVTGRIAPAPGVRVGAFDRTLSIDGASPRFESANLFARRSVFDELGGFRRLGRGGPRVEDGHFGEDALFGWRARRAGARIAYAPGALVHHAVFPRGPRGYIAERARLRFFPALVREAPELRGELLGRVFLTPRTARFDAAVAGVLAAAGLRRPWPLVAAVPYARRHLITAQPWRRGIARYNAAQVAADLVGLAALAWGGVRTRTPLL